MPQIFVVVQQLTIVESQQTLPGSCPQETVVIRTWTATDDCGNSDSVSQTVTMQDSESPVFSNVPADVTISCDDVVPTDEPWM
ncbi:MAG: hypothetical protein R2784_14140 [Saprospiraceae bacterium]